MGRVAVLASGFGSNFQAIYEALVTGPHEVIGLLCDNPRAEVVRRAERLHVPSATVVYDGSSDKSKHSAERRMMAILGDWAPDIIALAGFMRVLSPSFVSEYYRRIVNIHPSLLPHHRGLNAIQRSYEADDMVVGVTVHYVDEGVDTGKIIRREKLARTENETLADLESRIQALEHVTYPAVIRALLSELDDLRRKPEPA